MDSKLEFGEKLLKHRNLYVGFIVFLIILMILVFNLGSWLFLNRMGDDLDEELGKRLLSISMITARWIKFDYGASPKDQFYIYHHEIERILYQVKQENHLQSIFLINEDFDVIADDDLELTFPPRKRTDVQQDSLSLVNAWSGVASASPLHILEGSRFKSAYAPVINDDFEILAIVVVEANADFFGMLQLFKRGLIVSGLVSIVVAGLFAIFLYWAISLLLKSYERMRRSERLALMGQMAAGMAHEIRNPLGIMKGTAEVLQEVYDNPEKPNELFEFIPSEVDRLSRIVSDFLTFARGVQIEKRLANPGALLKKALFDLEREQYEKEIIIQQNIPAELIEIEFDPDAIQRVIYNLVRNGIQAMENGGVLTVSLFKFQKLGKRAYAIQVKDTGCGIDGDVNKIFDPFFTTKTKGTGLGLAITRQIIEKHDGWLYVESEPGKGTQITFYLPA